MLSIVLKWCSICANSNKPSLPVYLLQLSTLLPTAVIASSATPLAVHSSAVTTTTSSTITFYALEFHPSYSIYYFIQQSYYVLQLFHFLHCCGPMLRRTPSGREVSSTDVHLKKFSPTFLQPHQRVDRQHTAQLCNSALPAHYILHHCSFGRSQVVTNTTTCRANAKYQQLQRS